MLTCKVCGFKSKTELVDHIEKEHSDKSGSTPALDWYMAEFNCDVSDVHR